MTTSEFELPTEDIAERPSWAAVFLDHIRRYPLGAAGALVVLLMILMAVFAEVVAPYDPEANAFEYMLHPPSLQFWLGTDDFGRDILSRIIYGARTALFVGFVAASVGSSIGLVLGVASAYFGGWVAVWGAGVDKVIIAITIPFIPLCARVVRSSALSIREIPYVDAARACGFSHTRIIMRHMVQNVMAPYLIMFTSFVGQAILLEAVLSYLGLGVQEPTAAWGLMLKSGAEEYAEAAPWIPIFPGVAISLAVFGFNLFGDALRDAFDPKLRSQ